MLKKITILAIAILSVGSGYAQKSDAHKHVKRSQEAIQKPKLVVGLVIDQMVGIIFTDINPNIQTEDSKDY